MRFRKIFVTEQAHNLDLLANYTDDIQVLSNVNSTAVDSYASILENLYDYHPDLDAIVPMGRSPVCFMTGMAAVLRILLRVREEKSFATTITIGIFNDNEYYFERIPLE